MTVTIELPEDSVCLHMVLIQNSEKYTTSGMYQIDPRKEGRVRLAGVAPEQIQESEE